MIPSNICGEHEHNHQNLGEDEDHEIFDRQQGEGPLITIHDEYIAGLIPAALSRQPDHNDCNNSSCNIHHTESGMNQISTPDRAEVEPWTWLVLQHNAPFVSFEFLLKKIKKGSCFKKITKRKLF